MASTGIHRRLRRLQGSEGRFLLLALDHGLPAGPLPGIEDPRPVVEALRGTPVTGVIANPGIARLLPPAAAPPLIVHLSAGTLLGTAPTSKVLAASPERALALGAEAVSAQIYFGAPAEERMVAEVGKLIDDASRLGLPTLVMAYPPPDRAGDVDVSRRSARAAAELRAAFVQTPYTGSIESFREVVRGCPAPVIVTGGPKASSPEAFLESVRGAMNAGAAGVAAGRNLFQDPDPRRMAARIGGIVFGAAGPKPVVVAR